MPSLPRRIANFFGAAVRHAADGAARVPLEVYEERLTTCSSCSLRREDWVCQHKDCGCYLGVKAAWRSEACPLGLWARQGGDDATKSQKPGEVTPPAPGDTPADCGCGKK